MPTHAQAGPFDCAQCGKCFSSRFKLTRHSLIHSEERHHKCPSCERCFHRKDHLKNHLQVHNLNKSVFDCTQCAKKYTSRLSYRKHLAIHSAHSGRLDCGLCGQMFSDMDQVLYHLKVHSGSRVTKSPLEKRFQCEMCDRRFFTRKDVKRHLVVHTGKREFACQLCPQRFGRKDHLVRHTKKGHDPNSLHPANERDHLLGSGTILSSYPTAQLEDSYNRRENKDTSGNVGGLKQEDIYGTSDLQGHGMVQGLYTSRVEEGTVSVKIEPLALLGSGLNSILGAFSLPHQRLEPLSNPASAFTLLPQFNQAFQ